MDKPKRKNDNICPECEYGVLVQEYVMRSNDKGELKLDTCDLLRCDVCYVRFDSLTHEPLHEVTFNGAYNRLRVSVLDMIDVAYEPMKPTVDKVINDLIRLVESLKPIDE